VGSGRSHTGRPRLLQDEVEDGRKGNGNRGTNFIALFTCLVSYPTSFA